MFEILQTDDIKEYVYTIKTYYPMVDLLDYQDGFGGIREITCMIHKMIVGGDCCHYCPCVFRPEKEFDVVTRDGIAYFEEYIYCARCSMMGLK